MTSRGKGKAKSVSGRTLSGERSSKTGKAERIKHVYAKKGFGVMSRRRSK